MLVVTIKNNFFELKMLREQTKQIVSVDGRHCSVIDDWLFAQRTESQS